MTDALPLDPDSLHRKLVRYFHDCLAAQTDWARAINVIDQQDVTLVPLAASEQQRLGADGFIRLSDPDAVELAKRVSAGGAEAALFLGALFLVGRIEAQGDQAEKRFCAPLLEVPLSLREEPDGQIVIYPDEDEFTVNYSLVGELLEGDEDDLQDRLADLAELVPDFPMDAGEFDNFWNGFRMIAPEIPLSDQPPLPGKTAGSTRIADLGLVEESRGDVQAVDSNRLELVDFFVPTIAKDDEFRLLKATAIVLGRKAGREMSALSELRAMEALPLSQTALGCVLDPPTARPWSCEPSSRIYPDDVQPLPLTPAQESIVESSRSAPLTVVTGPPGTGKSYTITAIVLDALLNGQSVLVASQMDKAVEVVADQVEALAGSRVIARSGGRAAQRQLAKKVAHLTGPLNGLDDVVSSTVNDCAQRHYDLTRQVQQLEDHFRKFIEAERHWSHTFDSLKRFEPLCPLPIKDVGEAEVGKADRLVRRALRNSMDDAGIVRRMLAGWDLARARRLLSVPAGREQQVDDLTQLLHLHHLRTQLREVERYLKVPFPADLVWEQLDDAEQRRHQTAIELLRLMRSKQLRALVSNRHQRTALRDLATLLRRRKPEVKRQLQEKLSSGLLLEAFPAWACTTRSLCQVLPATPALFDIVVIDEASQCDLALASVALMRGKRAVVVGDPNQLRHVSFLSGAREQAAFMRSEFTAEMQERYRYRRSLFDVAADAVDQRHFFFLDEHFRSHPQIIEFSNRRFYDTSLHIMTSRPTPAPQSAIDIQWVDGRREAGSSVNRKEVDAVIQTVNTLTADTGASSGASIGIVSPFRDHADAIRERLLREFPSELLAKHSVIVGTAHSLQGDEKDIIIFSTSIDSDAHPASLRFLETPNLFNVAITRARRELIVVTSVARDQLPPGLLREFMSYAIHGWSTSQSPDASDCQVEARVAEGLRAAGIDCWTGFHSAGKRINVVATGEKNAVAILCDGGNAVQDIPSTALDGHRRLARAGWTLCRISDRTAQSDWDACKQTILKRLAE